MGPFTHWKATWLRVTADDGTVGQAPALLPDPIPQTLLAEGPLTPRQWWRRIWWMLRTRVGRPVTLFRTQAEWLEESVRSGGGASLDEGERAGLTRLRRQLAASDQASAPDVGDGLRLIDALLRLGAKVEQERW